jgi:hypothetical protein
MPTIFPPTMDIAGGPDREPGGRMTEVQAVELRELCDRLDEPFDAELTQRQADARIAVLRRKLGE